MKRYIHPFFKLIILASLFISNKSYSQICPNKAQSEATIVIQPETCDGDVDGSIEITFLDGAGVYDPSLGDFTPGTGDYQYSLFEPGNGFVYDEVGYDAGFSLNPAITLSYAAPSTITFNNLPPSFVNGTSGYVIVLTGGTCIPPRQFIDGIFGNVVGMGNPRPTPTITPVSGDFIVCFNEIDTYSTESGGGESGYDWTITGGTILGGGDGNDNVMVQWDGAGPYGVSINYLNSFGCPAVTPTNQVITVNTLPVPTITAGSGDFDLCFDDIDTYTTESGQVGYDWTVSGGTITVGGDGFDNVTVQWNLVGPYSVSITYLDLNGCGPITPVNQSVTVNPLPVATITSGSGDFDVCFNEIDTYTTEAGQGSYDWTVTGGTTTAGGDGNDNVTVQWDGAGPYNVSVTYVDVNGCSPATPASQVITVNARPSPTITAGSGSFILCFNTSDSYTTEAGQGVYDWTIVGGTISAGGDGNDNVTVLWDGAGPYSVSINYQNAAGCPAETPTSQVITVNPLPVPTITAGSGDFDVCFDDIDTYTTEAGQGGYDWTISGGTITVGGDGFDNVTVQWNLVGPYNVTITYVDGNLCTPATPTSQVVTVNPLPVATITSGSGDFDVCINEIDTYTTEAGQGSYDWTVTGGTTTAGGDGNDNVTVQWDGAGPYNVSVTYVDVNGCSPATPASQVITVNARPSPTITAGSGSFILCFNTSDSYTTEAGQGVYDWTIVGGTISAGGDGNDNVTVLWDGAGPYSVSINYQNAAGCPAETPTSQVITVNPLPVPTITAGSGDFDVCFDDIDTYTTEAGQGGYDWTISGGTITVGGDGFDNVTVQWNLVGPYNVTVTYVDGNLCTPATPTSQVVTVNPLPVATITSGSGDFDVCINEIDTYTTEAGQGSYDWTVTGGTTTAGGDGNDNVTVQWDGAGPYNVSVTYVDVNGCSPATPASQVITVNARPSPTITAGSGSFILCFNTSDSYTTEAGQGVYDWTIVGGTISAGGDGNDNVTVLWDGAGPYSVSINYQNAAGCPAETPTSQVITVNPLPVPTITAGSGDFDVCFDDIDTYTTEAGQGGYDWTISGGTITVGGDGFDNVTVQWNLVGPYNVTITYVDGNLCTPATPTSQVVTVNPLPVATITSGSGDFDVCINEIDTYTTEAGQGSYDWTVTGGTTTAGGDGNDNVTVQWDGAGPYNVSVTYVDVNGCSPATPASQVITVNARPSPTITAGSGSFILCFNTSDSYTTEAGQGVYDWTIVGGTISAGGDGNDNVTVLWDGAGPYSVSINYQNAAGCPAETPTSQVITVNPLPVPTITAGSGDFDVCFDDIDTYTTEAGQGGYDWTISGGTITVGGDGFDNVTVQWNLVGPYNVTITYVDGNLCTPATPTSQVVTVNPLPVATITSGSGDFDVCFNEIDTYTTEAGQGSYDWTVTGGTTTAGGDGNDNVTVQWDGAGPYNVSVTYVDVNGCSPATPASQVITVNARPSPTITAGSGSFILCFNTSDSYTTEAGQGVYDWTIVGGTISAGGDGNDNVTVLWDGAGPYSVSINYQNAAGCPAETPTSQVITVNSLPVVTFTGLNISHCIDEAPVLLTGDQAPNGTFSGPGITDNGDGTATFDPLVAGLGGKSILYSFTDLNGCIGADVQPTTVVPIPTVSFTGLGPSYCESDSPVSLSGTPIGTGGIWTTTAPGGLTDNGDGTADFDPAGAGGGTWDVTFTYTDSNGCSDFVTQSVIINPLTDPVFTGSTLVCLTAPSVSYSVVAGQTNYIWVVSAGGTVDAGGSTTDNFVDVTWTAAGTENITITFTDTNGCVVNRSEPINIFNSTPLPTVTSPVDVCQSDPAPALTIGGYSGQTVTWYDDATLFSVVGSGEFYTPSTSELDVNTPGLTSFYVTQTIGTCGESAPSQIDVIVNLLPNAGTDANVDACEIETPVNLFNELGGTPDAGGVWNDDDGSGALVGVLFNPSVAGPGTFNFTYTATSPGCVDDQSVVTMVVEAQLDPGTDVSVGACIIDTSLDLFTVLGGSPDLGGTWVDVNSSGALTGSIFDPSTAGAGTFNFTYSFSGLVICANSSATVTVTVGNVSPPPILDGPSGICAGDPAPVLNAIGTNVEWYAEPTLITLLGSGNSYTPGTELNTSLPGTTQYYVTQDVGCGQSTPAPYDVNVLALSNPPTIASVPDLCLNDPIPQLVATGTDILWHSDILASDTLATGSVFIPAPGQLDTDVIGTTSFFATQNTGCGRSTTTEIVINVINCAGSCFTQNIVTSTASCLNIDGSVSFNLDGNEVLPVSFRLFELSGTDTVFQQIQSGSFFDSLSTATYDYEIIDSQGCAETGQVTVQQRLTTLDVTLTTPTTINCVGEESDIDVTVTNGTAPFEYSTDGGLNWQTLVSNRIQLAAGIYDIYVRDDPTDPCPFITTGVDITSPNALTYTIEEPTESFPERASGTIKITDVAGGLPPYQVHAVLVTPLSTYPGQNFDQTFDIPFEPEVGKYEILLDNLFAGTYTIEIIDANMCVTSVLYLSSDPLVPLDDSLFIPNVFTPNEDGYNDLFFIRNLPDDTDTQLTITNRVGKQVFSSNSYNNDWGGGNLPNGIYYYTVHITVEGQLFEYKGWVEIWKGQ